jgi:hypothetical protein
MLSLSCKAASVPSRSSSGGCLLTSLSYSYAKKIAEIHAKNDHAKHGIIVFSGSVGKKPADNTQPPEKLYPPISFSEAHLKHIWSTFKAFLKHLKYKTRHLAKLLFH